VTGLNRHPIKRCDTCEFWARGDQWEFNEERHPDDRTATCRRNAPRATVGEFEYQLLEHLTTIAWQYNDNQKDFNDWEEACLHTSSWPSTCGSDWCGEWQRKEEAT
jgi:hypothetical protein